MSDNKTLIHEYLRALSGLPKPSDVVCKYVADEKLAQHIADVESAFPNYEILIDEMVAEGDKVVVCGRFRGTQTGSFAGIEPTGATATAGLMILYKVENNRITDHRMQFDLFGLLQQLRGATDAVPA